MTKPSASAHLTILEKSRWRPFAAMADLSVACRMWLVVAALVAVRLVAAALIPLYWDEAYYWTWSKVLAAGYYDHPPAVAFMIRLGTLIAGDSEFGVRVVGVLLALPATWAVWRAAAMLFGEAVAAPAALYFNLTLLISYVTIIATPDAPLLLASALMLWSLAKVATTDKGAWWLAVGGAAGFGLLAKYNTVLLGAGILAWLTIDPAMRRWLWSPWPYLGGTLALALFAPVIVWNAAHGWMSFLFQSGRFRAGIGAWQVEHLGEFFGGQILLATPAIYVLGAAGLIAFLVGRGNGTTRSARILIGALCWPMVLYFAWHSLFGYVDASWLTPIYPAFAVAAAVAAHQLAWRGTLARVIAASRRVAVPLALAIFAFGVLQAAFGLIPAGRRDPTARKLGAGWRIAGAEIDALRQRTGALGVLAPNYTRAGLLSFYLPSHPPVIQINERYRYVDAPAVDPKILRGPLLFATDDGTDWTERLSVHYARVGEIARVPLFRRGVEIDRYAVYLLQDMTSDPLDDNPPGATWWRYWVAQALPSVRVAKSGQTTENELVFSSDRMAFKPGVYRLTVSFDTNVCLDKDISPIVLSILNHQDNQIVKVEAVEPSSQASCETGSLQFEFQTSGLGLLEMNLYARWVLSLPHAPIIKYLERSN